MATEMEMALMTGSKGLRAAALAAVLLGPVPAFAAEPVTGNWLTEESKALVQIEACGKTICGKIVKVLKPTPGRPTTDLANPDPRLRSHPIAGTYILTGFVDAGSLWKGKIYDPQSGKTYAGKLMRNPDGSLKVQGCIAFMCKGPTWQPAR